MNFDSLAKEFFPDSLLSGDKDFYVNKSRAFLAEDAAFENFKEGDNARELQLDQEHAIQKFIRPIFLKSNEYNQNPIGDHPDYSNLVKNGSFQKGYISTLFMDIVKSSRLNLLHDLEVACEIKNRILKTSIEVVRAFDGYPHRMMGDAMMAFFGDRNISKEQACINAINCACVLKYFIETFVVPQIDRQLSGKDSKLGIRVGVDFGDDDSVIWGAFGYRSAYEITAHGVSVDLCSKLQGMADKNSIMLGRGVIDFLDFPDSFMKVKEKKSKDGAVKKIYHVLPNITDSNDQSINYKCRMISDKVYFDLLPLSPLEKGLMDEGSILNNILFLCEFSRDGHTWEEYKSVSFPLDKELKLRFSVYVPANFFNSVRKFDCVFSKTNHGAEAASNNRDIEPHVTYDVLTAENPTVIKNGSPYKVAVRDERTKYRGIHEMRFEGGFNGSSIPGKYSNAIGVLIN